MIKKLKKKLFEFIDNLIVSKEQYEKIVLNNYEKTNINSILIVLIIFTIIVSFGICFLLHNNEFGNIFVWYIIIVFILFIIYLLIYLLKKEWSYYIFILLMLSFFPLFPIYFLNTIYEKIFKMNSKIVWLPIVSIIILSFITIFTPIISSFLFDYFKGINILVPEVICVFLVFIFSFIFKSVLIYLYVKFISKINSDNIIKYVGLRACICIVIEYIIFIIYYQIYFNNLHDECIILYYTDKLYLIYTCFWLIDSIMGKIDFN